MEKLKWVFFESCQTAYISASGLHTVNMDYQQEIKEALSSQVLSR